MVYLIIGKASASGSFSTLLELLLPAFATSRASFRSLPLSLGTLGVLMVDISTEVA